MSHQIMEHDSPAYALTPAWHGLGTVIPHHMNSIEALKEGHLDWEVEKEQVVMPFWSEQNDKGERSLNGLISVPDRFMTVRTDLPKNDPNRVLGMVQGRYEPLQNMKAFEIADAVAGESGMKFESIGSLCNGKVIWLLGICPDSLKVGNDQIDKFLLFKTSHDGSTSMEIGYTPTRVVCWNTLSVALKNLKNKFTIRHTESITARIEEAKRVLKYGNSYFNGMVETWQQMAQRKVSDRFVQAYLEAILPTKKPDGDERKRQLAAHVAIEQLYRGGQPGATTTELCGTAYGLLNATTQYIQHVMGRRVSQGKSAAEARFSSVMDGAGAKMRQTATDLLVHADELEQKADTILAGGSLSN